MFHLWSLCLRKHPQEISFEHIAISFKRIYNVLYDIIRFYAISGELYMSGNTGYKKQQSLSFAQFLTEIPSFIIILAAAILSRTLIIFVDLLDSLGYIIRNVMIICISRRLSKDLRFEYNYGVGKIEAISSIFGDGIVLFGMCLTLCLSVYSFTNSSIALKVSGFFVRICLPPSGLS